MFFYVCTKMLIEGFILTLLLSIYLGKLGYLRHRNGTRTVYKCLPNKQNLILLSCRVALSKFNKFCFSKIILGDEIEERPNMLKIIPEEGLILNLSFPSSSDMFSWMNYLQAAKQFKVIFVTSFVFYVT